MAIRRDRISWLTLTGGLILVAWSASVGSAQTSLRRIEVDGRPREYLLHVPRGLASTQAAPLVLVFHGGGGDGAGTERLTGFSALADRERIVVAYPNGVGRNWNDGRDVPDSAAHRERVDDVGFVAALLDAVGRERAIDPRRVYATGISNGGVFSHYLAAKLSERIAAIAPVVGGIADGLRPVFAPRAPVSVLIFQGTADPLVPYGGGGVMGGRRGRIISTDETVRLWVEANGAALQPVVEDLPDTDPQDGCRAKRFTHAGGRAGAEVVLIRLEGGGHTWPGGAQYLPQRLIGRVCRDVDGTAAIWSFFRAHSKP